MLHEMTAERTEMSLIASLVLDRDTYPVVADRITPEAFEHAKWRAIFSAIDRCWKKRMPADVTTVCAELAGDPLYERNEGQAVQDIMDAIIWLDTSHGFACHAPHYADAVVAFARRRALSDVGANLVKMAHEGGTLDANLAVHEVMTGMDRFGATTEQRGPQTYDEIIPGYQDQIIAMMNGEIPNRVTGTGWTYLDRKLAGGLYPGELVILAARPAMGKALALDTPIPTPTGWTTMGELREGDQVFGRDGNPCRVTMKTPVQHDRECYLVRFDDGSTITADSDHRWVTSARNDRKAGRDVEQVVTTKQILDTLMVGDRANHAVRNTQAIDGDDIDLPISPYTLGAWLGDGDQTGRITKPDEEVFAGIEQESWTVGPDISAPERTQTKTVYGLKVALRSAGLLGGKHIPDIYLRASKSQRVALVRGLMDTDGSIRPNGVAEYSSTSKALAEGMVDLILGMGWRCSMREGRATIAGIDYGPKYVIRFMPMEQVFTIPRKVERFRGRVNPRSTTRYIVAVEPVPTVPVACITVDSPDHTYLCGKAYIPTHNTAFALQMGHQVAKAGKHVVVFSAEMSKESLLKRAVADLMGRALDKPEYQFSGDEFNRFLQSLDRLRGVPMSIDDTPGITTAQMQVRIQNMQRRHDVGLVIFDYIELAGDQVKGDSEERRINDIVKALKKIARICDVPVLALCQLNRQVESSGNKRPMLSHLRYSGSIEQDADKVLFLYRHDYYVNQGTAQPEAGTENTAEVIVSKHRNGATGDVKLRFTPETMRFDTIDYKVDLRPFNPAA